MTTAIPDSFPVLEKAREVLAQRQKVNVTVAGHTDNVGGDAYNLKLSTSRALTVRSWFEKHGIAAARLSSQGFGKTQPVADNDSDVGRAKNRRVELVGSGCKK